MTNTTRNVSQQSFGDPHLIPSNKRASFSGLVGFFFFWGEEGQGDFDKQKGVLNYLKKGPISRRTKQKRKRKEKIITLAGEQSRIDFCGFFFFFFFFGGGGGWHSHYKLFKMIKHRPYIYAGFLGGAGKNLCV